jgi:maltoporin
MALFQGSTGAAGLLAMLLALAAPSAWAEEEEKGGGPRLELSMYGRIGLAWAPTGDLVLGQRLNLTGRALGGRLEEGDYLEPTLTIHLVEPAQGASREPFLRVVVTPSLFARGSFLISAFSTGFAETLGIELFQAYVTAGHFLVPDLTLWAGVRFYREGDVHISDYYYFNELSGQGVGAQYGPLEAALLVHTAEDNPLYETDLDGDGTVDRQRVRTVLTTQYKRALGAGFSVRLLGELHLLPDVKTQQPENALVRPGDHGWVLGIKGRLDLGEDSFNELSVRYGRRIANGSYAGEQTWSTFGRPGADDRYGNGLGLEVVERFVADLTPYYGLNAYGVLHYAHGSSGLPEDAALDFAVGQRSTLFLTDTFHLIQEASFQGLRRGRERLATAVKLTLMPTLVPTGKRTIWARPHLRLFYTVAFYDDEAVRTLASPYLQALGATPVAHYFGTQVEWWF